MLTVAQLQINASCSFEVYPSTILGTDFKGVKILAILDAATTAFYGFDAAAMHANVYPMLAGTGTPNDYTAYSYVLLAMPSGQKQVIGIPWIKDSTFVISQQRTVQFSIDNINDTDVTKILAVLSANGYTANALTYTQGQ